MNAPKYAKIYAQYHLCCSSSVVGNNTVVLEYDVLPFAPYLVSRMFGFETLAEPNRPMVQALSVFFKNEAPTTTFLKEDSFTLLLGKDRVLIPKEGGKCKLYASPYFVHDPKVVEAFLRGMARPVHDDTYIYKNSVLYLDPDDLPCPGSNYFRPGKRKRRESFRICFLSEESDTEQFFQKVIKEWEYRQDVTMNPFAARDTIRVPKFIDFKPSSSSPVLPDDFAVSTSTIKKENSESQFPGFLIQDVLLSYETEDVRHLGLIIEYPFRLHYDGSHCIEGCRPASKQFVALAVNGARPKRTLKVRDPYERYVEYDYVPDNVQWTEIFFARDSFDLPPGVNLVAIDSVVIGIEYHRAFLCLSAPLLECKPRRRRSLHADCLLTPVSQLSELRVLDTSRLDGETSLLRVRVGDLPWDFYCVTRQSDTRYPKRLQMPNLVEKWLQFYVRNKDKTQYLGDLQTVRLGLVLAKHKICFKTNIVQKIRGQEAWVDEGRIVLQMSDKGAEFVNQMRLEGNNVEQESNCTIL